MYRKILSKEQIELLDLIKEFKERYYMAGGTAIALQIGHRRSLDFDLFTDKSLDTLRIGRIIKRMGYRVEATLEESREELTVIINGVKITFLEYPFRILHEVNFDNIITMPDILTLSAMKAYSLGRRSKWKDYVDLYFVLKDYFSVSEVAARAREIFGGEFNERLFRSQLCFFEDIDYSESVDFVDEAIDNTTIKDFLTGICTEV